MSLNNITERGKCSSCDNITFLKKCVQCLKQEIKNTEYKFDSVLEKEQYSELWVDKYAPQDLNTMIGNKASIQKAKTWINRRNFNTKKLIFKQGTKRQDKVNGRVLFSQNNMTSGEINNLSSILENPKMLELINEQSEIQLDNIDLSLASDAFFPFRDSIDVADSFNVKYIIQPGGSIADEGVIEACNEYNVIMCTTGKRQFLH